MDDMHATMPSCALQVTGESPREYVLGADSEDDYHQWLTCLMTAAEGQAKQAEHSM